jgi:crossover junction endodeoxyribonuclease RusA
MRAFLVTEFFVPGIPQSQGSKVAFVVKGRAILADANRVTLKPWRAAVTDAAAAAYDGPRIEGPVLLTAEFRFVKPKSVKRDLPAVPPDVDKLVRSLADSITDSGIWRDDAQVVRLTVEKVYAERAGVLVRIGEYRKA